MSEIEALQHEILEVQNLSIVIDALSYIKQVYFHTSISKYGNTIAAGRDSPLGSECFVGVSF